MKELKERTREFALSVIKLCGGLPKDEVARVLGKQLLRSGTSVGAHYREGMRSRSDAEFISKLEGGMQELEETMYWCELLQGSGFGESAALLAITDEANQLMAILTTIVKKRKARP